MNQVVFGL